MFYWGKLGKASTLNILYNYPPIPPIPGPFSSSQLGGFFIFHHPLRARAMNTRSLNIFNMDSVLLLPLPALGGQGFQRRPAPPNSIWKVQNVPPIPGWKAWQRVAEGGNSEAANIIFLNWSGWVLGTERAPKTWTHSTFKPSPPTFVPRIALC